MNQEILKKWELEVLEKLPSTHYDIFRVRPQTNSREAHELSPSISPLNSYILKCGKPSREFQQEILSLKYFQSNNVVNILKIDLDAAAILLEDISPGTPLHSLDDETKEIEIYCGLVRDLHSFPKIKEPNSSFPSVLDWFEETSLEKTISHLGQPGEKIVRRSMEILQHLRKSDKSTWRLLHGDLHHDNILFSKNNQWKIIDSQGVLAPMEWEVVAFMRNPIKRITSSSTASTLSPILKKRAQYIAQFFGWDEELILHYTLAQTVLSMAWDLEYSGPNLKTWANVAISLWDLPTFQR